MPFLEPETALPVVIVASVKGDILRDKIRALAAGKSGSTYFQRLAPRLNDLPTIILGGATKPTRRDVACNVYAGVIGAVGKTQQAASLRGLPIAPLSVGYQRGLRRLSFPSYNEPVMSTVRDAAQESQFAFARVLAALSSVPAALSGKLTFAIAPQPLR
jgi:hypothetical protein